MPEARGICHICHMVNPALYAAPYENTYLLTYIVHVQTSQHSQRYL